MKEYGEMQFMASSPPAADAGEYRVKVHQNVTSPVAEEIPGAEFRFFAGEKRFELEQGEIYEAYPPAGMVSDYGVTLPHIIFYKKAYPWDRRIGGGPALRENTPVKNQTPWIALLLFDEDEEPKLSEVTLQKLLNKEEKCFFPLAGTGLQPGKDWDNTCSVIRMSPELFKKAVPMEAELPWLAHVRITDLHERPDNIIAHPGYFGVIVCSRFPQAVDRTVRCTAHLVSLEGFSGYLPGGWEEAWKNEDWIQMVSLYHWEFSSRKSSEESFRTLTEKLDSGRLSLYQSGEPLPGGPAHAVERLQKGYTVLNHIVRTGEQTASWYRGPLTPEKPDSSLQGQNAGADGRFREDGLLSVRRDREVITSVSFMEGGGKISWDSKTIKPFCDEFTQRADVPQAAYQLYDETAFLYLAEGGSGKEYTGTLPSAVSVTCFHPPWNPLFLDWRLHFLPSRTQADPDNTMEDWRLGDIDYSYKGAGEAGELKQYRGRMIITPHAAQGLSDAITRHIETFRYNETLYRQLSAIAGKAKELPVLSQNMSGLNEAFLCKDQAVSFPIFGVTKTAVSFADAVRAQVGDYGELSLNVNMEFLPVRAGFIRPDALRMIDTFGQTAELDSYLNDIAVAESIRPEGGGEYGVLPPRLSGPGSLCLDWEEKAPEFSPVCGYLMPDFLNSRISIYDEAGGYEGNLHLVWLPDGSTRAGFTALEDGKKRTLSGHMRHFIHGMTESGDGVFRAFLKLIDERLSERISAGGDEDQELSMLTGRPLAMLRGGLSLRWQGLLPYSKALKDFGKRNTYGFEENTYEARIGDVRYASDGLIGYYRGEETGSTYRTFYPAYGAKTMKDPYFSCNSDLELKVQHEKVPLTFLLDVTGSIHIRTGILPVYEKKPDPVFFRDALEHINLRLPIYPILTGPERAGIPQIGGKEPFFWYCRKNGALERREIGEPPVAAEMHQEKNSLEDGFMSRE